MSSVPYLRLSAIAAACLLGGCNLGIAADNATLPNNNQILNGYDAGAPDAGPDAVGEEGGRMAYEGSPLCGYSYTSACQPDDLYPDCQTPSPDAGTVPGMDDAGSPSPYACRVSTESGKATPTCFPSSLTTHLGYNGTSCVTPADCAPGYDCVTENAADGGVTHTCRHYCCYSAACGEVGPPLYCGVQPLAANGGVNVPVCMPVIPGCHLLQNDCPGGQTCTVVDQGGSGLNYAATCVDVGTSQLGDSCETENCGADLACLGKPQQRQCWQLCGPSTPCPTGQSCTNGEPPFFTSDATSNYGICQPAK
jgi:hypothetical protein